MRTAHNYPLVPKLLLGNEKGRRRRGRLRYILKDNPGGTGILPGHCTGWKPVPPFLFSQAEAWGYIVLAAW